MNIHSWLPLCAAIAFIPLFVILIANRSWQKPHKLLLWYLIAATLWSLTDFLFRSDFLPEYKLILVKIVVCMGMWSSTQLLCFVRSYYHTRGFPIPFAYTLLGITITLTALGYIPKSLDIQGSAIYVNYGIWFSLTVLIFVALISRDIYSLLRKFRESTVPEERNQIVYILAGVFFLIALIGITVTPAGGGYPVAHIGNFANAFILTYITLKHRLLDINFVARRSLGWLGQAFAVSAIFVLLFSLIHWLTGVELMASTMTLIILVAIAASASAYLLRGFFFKGVDWLFYRQSYDYRQQLQDFVHNKLIGINSLDELGEELLSLLARVLDCQSAFLLLPAASSGDFVASFPKSATPDTPQLRIRQDGPIAKWLQRENHYLHQESLDIMPEFRGLWAEERESLKAKEIEWLFPLINRGSLVAILALGRKKSGKYLLEDINLVESITVRLATSLEKEYLKEQLRKREQELSMLNRLIIIINSSLEMQDVYDAFIGELRNVIRIDWATVGLIEGEYLRFQVLASQVGSAWQEGERIPLKGTGAEWLVGHKKALVEPDLSQNRRFWTGERHLEHGIRSIVYLPLIVSGDVIGSMIIASRQPNAYSPEQVQLLERLASQISMAIANSQLYAKAEQRARIDELTGLFNRRHFDESIKQEIDQCSRYGGVLSLIILDLDWFKTYNDSYGHAAGDKILAQIGQLIKESVRSSDMPFRYGGDEFAILLPNSEGEEALVVAERIRQNIAKEMSARQIAITVSLGLACWPADGITPDEIVNAADSALYYAKQTGHNRTCVASKMLTSSIQSPVPRNNVDREAMSIIYALAAAIEARDPYTYGHSRKVSNYAVALAEALGLPAERIACISTAALLHDIGKMGIPDEVLNKTTELTAHEWELIKCHPKLSATIVGHILSLAPCLPAILHHHERWDGSGYPAGLKGELIPFEARILAIVDAFGAMVAPRSYRAALSYKVVLEELRRGAGTQFDPRLVEAFLPIALSSAPEEHGVEEDYNSLKADS